jgi:hypothetical protein
MTTGQVPGPAIHLRALQKSYGEQHVLRGVDFDVSRAAVGRLRELIAERGWTGWTRIEKREL